MIIGVLLLELHFPGARSLKDKRKSLSGFRDRVRGRHNAAVAELDFQDKWQRARIGVVTINSNRCVVENVLARILSEADMFLDGEVVGHELQVF
jgi:uncharacterized protein